jgi:hypothetical protein
LGSEDVDINKWSPELIGLSNANKLRKLFIGVNTTNTVLEAGLSVSNSPLLERLEVAHLPKYNNTLNLTS